MKNLIIFGSIIILLIIGGLLVFTNKKPMNFNQPKPKEQPTETVIEKKAEKTYTLEQVAEHKTSDDCFMAINGKVYDVTKFVSQHPGGKIIATACGRDASILFNLRPNSAKSPHPDQANTELGKLYIGELIK